MNEIKLAKQLLESKGYKVTKLHENTCIYRGDHTCIDRTPTGYIVRTTDEGYHYFYHELQRNDKIEGFSTAIGKPGFFDIVTDMDEQSFITFVEEWLVM